mmetsp:Transcript_10639/g.17277  ORF Transcript_10639/g.17277 Transcript_10639/m.17277 type:complete len:229 (+) Transcript_10639:1336-2022(+)
MTTTPVPFLGLNLDTTSNSTDGIMKANVFPDPVFACATMSFPARRGGIHIACTRVIVGNPSSLTAEATFSDTFKLSNFISNSGSKAAEIDEPVVAVGSSPVLLSEVGCFPPFLLVIVVEVVVSASSFPEDSNAFSFLSSFFVFFFFLVIAFILPSGLFISVSARLLFNPPPFPFVSFFFFFFFFFPAAGLFVEFACFERSFSLSILLSPFNRSRMNDLEQVVIVCCGL